MAISYRYGNDLDAKGWFTPELTPSGWFDKDFTETVASGGTVTATASAPLGAASAAAVVTVKHPASGTSALGGLAGAATGIVSHPASGSAPLGSASAAAVAAVSHTATASASLGPLSAAAEATGGTATPPDDGNQGSHGGYPVPRHFPKPKPNRVPLFLDLPAKTVKASASSSLGAMSASATATVEWAAEEHLLLLV